MPNPTERVFLTLGEAEDIVSRLDERLRLYGGGGALAARLDYDEASAWAWNSGLFATTEDLLLHHEAMDVRIPTQDLRAAYDLVLARRKAALSGPELLSPDGAKWLMAVRKAPPAARNDASDAPSPALDPDRPDLCSGLTDQIRAIEAASTEGADAAFQEWLSILLAPRTGRPHLLQAALALEAWTLIKPFPRTTYLGPLLVGAWLRGVKRVPTHLITLQRGLRAWRRRHHRRADQTALERITEWLNVIAEAARVTHAEWYRLELRRQQLELFAKDRRSHSRMNDAIKLIVESPLVTMPMMARSLKITQTSAARILEVLAPSLTEITGRARFRAWRA
ncbi:MAG: DUF1612 domain-containing protein [Caulobacteraceae bacterium]